MTKSSHRKHLLQEMTSQPFMLCLRCWCCNTIGLEEAQLVILAQLALDIVPQKGHIPTPNLN